MFVTTKPVVKNEMGNDVDLTSCTTKYTIIFCYKKLSKKTSIANHIQGKVLLQKGKCNL